MAGFGLPAAREADVRNKRPQRKGVIIRIAFWMLTVWLVAPPAVSADSIQITSGVLTGAGESFMSLSLSLEAPDAALAYSGSAAYPISGVEVGLVPQCGYFGCSPGLTFDLDTAWYASYTEGGWLTVDGSTYRVGWPYSGSYPFLFVRFDGSWTVPELGSATTATVITPFVLDGYLETPSLGGDRQQLFGYGLATIYLSRGESRWYSRGLNYTITPEDPTVPEPSSLVLLGTAVAMFGLRRKARKRATSLKDRIAGSREQSF
jgi:hypothetical protein